MPEEERPQAHLRARASSTVDTSTGSGSSALSAEGRAPDGRGAPLQPTGPLSVGERLLGRYRITKRIAAGGLSVVYRAEDERLERPVCVKVFNLLSSSDQQFRVSYKQFLQEVFALSKLSHPNTLRIFDYGFVEKTGGEQPAPFQVSELANGGTLAQLVAQHGRRPAREVLAMARAICGSLAESHGCGIIHRDVKPQNILFSRVGRSLIPKLADFGIATILPGAAPPSLEGWAGDETPARVQMLMYSTKWAAPEQMLIGVVAPATDVYALALVTTFALSGRPVFLASDRQKAIEERMESDERVAAALRDVELPPEAVQILQRACRARVEQRPPNVDLFFERFAAAFDRQALAASLSTETQIEDPEATGPTEVSEQLPVPAPTPAPVPAAAPRRRLELDAASERLGGRELRFLRVEQGHAEVVCPENARLRLGLIVDGSTHFFVHLQGLNCFVSLADGPPTRALQLDRPATVNLVKPNRQRLAQLALVFGGTEDGEPTFSLGGESVALDGKLCRQVVGLDFGQARECWLIYAPRLPGASDPPRLSPAPEGSSPCRT